MAFNYIGTICLFLTICSAFTSAADKSVLDLQLDCNTKVVIAEIMAEINKLVRDGGAQLPATEEELASACGNMNDTVETILKIIHPCFAHKLVYFGVDWLVTANLNSLRGKLCYAGGSLHDAYLSVAPCVSDNTLPIVIDCAIELILQFEAFESSGSSLNAKTICELLYDIEQCTDKAVYSCGDDAVTVMNEILATIVNEGTVSVCEEILATAATTETVAPAQTTPAATVAPVQTTPAASVAPVQTTPAATVAPGQTTTTTATTTTTTAAPTTNPESTTPAGSSAIVPHWLLTLSSLILAIVFVFHV